MIIIAVDPGVTKTGVTVLNMDGGKVRILAAATFTAARKADLKRSPHERAHDLVGTIETWLDEVWWKCGLDGTAQWLAIERPIYNKNPKGFELQWRVFQQIVERLTREQWVRQVSEVHNGTSKERLTGNGSAKKNEMLKHSPFSVAQFPCADDREAVTDAYAHGLAYDAGNPVYPATWAAPAAQPWADQAWVDE